MGGKSNAWETGLLKLLAQNENFAGVGDVTGLRGSSVAGSLFLSLHATNPGESGDQSTGEISYTTYARVPVARSVVGWLVSGSALSPSSNVDFPKASAGSFPIEVPFFGIGTDLSGPGTLLYFGGIGPAMVPATMKVDDSITVPNQAFLVDDRVVFWAMENLSLPSGLSEGTVYWVKSVSGDDITVSLTQGGAVINILAAGAGFAQKISMITISLNTIPRLTTDTVVREG